MYVCIGDIIYNQCLKDSRLRNNCFDCSSVSGSNLWCNSQQECDYNSQQEYKHLS